MPWRLAARRRDISRILVMAKSDDISWKGSNGGGTGWGVNPETGERIMPPLQSEYLDWKLSDPKIPSSIERWAEEHGVHKDTPRRWQRDKKFIAEWEKRAREKNISIDRVQSVVDSLHHQAVLQGNVKAAQLYLQYVDRFMPQVRVEVVKDTPDTEELSDAELAAQVAQAASEMASQGGLGSDPTFS